MRQIPTLQPPLQQSWRALLLAAAAAAVFAAPSAHAQSRIEGRAPREAAQASQARPASGERLEIGTYAVRPGDTLREISRRYSGGMDRWEDNWKLNPNITDPDRIQPGQRLRILLSNMVPENTARVIKVSRTVEEKPYPYTWEPSQVDHLLLERDNLRTRKGSSSEIAFPDGVRLQVTEGSLVVLEQVNRRLAGVPRNQIEIVEGQADLERRATGSRSAGRGAGSEIEIVLGDTRIKPESNAEGRIATRARKQEAGGQQVMVYEGSGTLDAGGKKVEVATGMGSTVPEGGAPLPPEKLLPAPGLVSPRPGAAVHRPNPTFQWEEVPGATSYVVEVCRDPECGAVEMRRTGILETRLAPDDLPLGELHWRATAVAPSGLDGYPAQATAFRITSLVKDDVSPSGELTFSGPQIRRGERLIVGPGAVLEAEARDEESGIGEWVYLLDGEEVDAETWRGGWSTGEHEAEARVADQAGNETRLGPVRFVSDPEPPRIAWEVGNDGLLDERGAPGARPADLSSRRLAREREEGLVLLWSADGTSWLALREPGAAGRQGGASASVQGDRPQIFLQAPGRDPLAGGSPVQLPGGRLLRLSAEDGSSGVGELRFEVRRAGEGRVLWIEAVDLVGNQKVETWPLVEGP